MYNGRANLTPGALVDFGTMGAQMGEMTVMRVQRIGLERFGFSQIVGHAGPSIELAVLAGADFGADAARPARLRHQKLVMPGTGHRVEVSREGAGIGGERLRGAASAPSRRIHD